MRAETYGSVKRLTRLLEHLPPTKQLNSRRIFSQLTLKFPEAVCYGAGWSSRTIEDRRSKIEDRRSKIEDRGSRIEDRRSRIEDRGSRIEDRGWKIEDGKVENRESKIETEGASLVRFQEMLRSGETWRVTEKTVACAMPWKSMRRNLVMVRTWDARPGSPGIARVALAGSNCLGKWCADQRARPGIGYRPSAWHSSATADNRQAASRSRVGFFLLVQVQEGCQAANRWCSIPFRGAGLEPADGRGRERRGICTGLHFLHLDCTGCKRAVCC